MNADIQPQGEPQTNPETPHDYTLREAELCLSAVLSYLAQMDIFIITHSVPSKAPSYEVRHGMGMAKSWSYYNTRHEAFAHALLKAQVVSAIEYAARAALEGGAE